MKFMNQMRNVYLQNAGGKVTLCIHAGIWFGSLSSVLGTANASQVPGGLDFALMPATSTPGGPHVDCVNFNSSWSFPESSLDPELNSEIFVSLKSNKNPQTSMSPKQL